ncbi:MAG: hypothetical protein WCI51_14275 [Lentisphaerota bacterium]
MTAEKRKFIKNHIYKSFLHTANLYVYSITLPLIQLKLHAVSFIEHIAADLISNTNNNPFAQANAYQKTTE